MNERFLAEQKLLLPDVIEWQEVGADNLPSRLEPGMVVTGLATTALMDQLEGHVVAQIVEDSAEDATHLRHVSVPRRDTHRHRLHNPKELNAKYGELSSALRDAGFSGRLTGVRAAIIPYDDASVRESAAVKEALFPIRGFSMLLAAQVVSLGGRPKAEFSQEVSYYGRFDKSANTIHRVLPASGSVDSWQEDVLRERRASTQRGRFIEAWRLASPVGGGSPGLGKASR